MAKDNIYDLHITELFFRVGSGNSNNVGAPRINLFSSTVGSNVTEIYVGSDTFTSEVINIPLGYSVKANSHIISYPAAVDYIGSDASITGTPVSVVLGVAGSTFTVTSTVTLEHSTDPDIVLNQTFIITAVLPMYYGFKAYSATPDFTGLLRTASTETQFQLISTSLNRMYIVLPDNIANLVSVTDPNGFIFRVASDFTKINSGGFNYYILNYDTILTGTNVKNFVLNFS